MIDPCVLVLYSWTQERLRSGDNDDGDDNNNGDIDENDYWYLGSMPRASPAVAVSVYGIPVDGHRHHSSQTASACHRKTFLNTFLIHPLRMVGDNDDNDDGFADYGDSICNEDEGQGMGCSSTGAFVWQEFALDWNGNAVCDARHTLTVLDNLIGFNTKLNQEFDCAQVAMGDGGGGDNSLSLYNLLDGAAACSFEDSACPDPFGVLRDYHALALGKVTVHDTTFASNLILGAAFLVLGSIGMIAWELLTTGGASDKGGLGKRRSKPRRRLSKKSRSKRRRQQRTISPKKSRRRVWDFLSPHCDGFDGDGDEPSMVSSLGFSVPTLELPRMDATSGPEAGNDDAPPPENDIPPIVSSLVPPSQTSTAKKEAHEDSMEIITQKRELTRGRSPADKKKSWFRTKSPIARVREHQLMAAAVAAATHAKHQEANVASEKPDSSDSDTNTERELKAHEEEEAKTEEKSTMAQALGSLVVKAMKPAGDDEAPSDEDETTAAAEPETATNKNNSDSRIVIPRIHVKMTEPGSNVSIVETIAEQKRHKDPKPGIFRGIVEKHTTSEPSDTLGQDPPGYLKRVPTLEKQVAKEHKREIEEAQSVKGSSLVSAQSVSGKGAAPSKISKLQMDAKREPTEQTSPALARSKSEKQRESDKRSFLNRVFRRPKS